MAKVASIPRSRGSVSGLALMLLGVWGGIAPYVGPIFGYGFTPDQAWQYTKGRLILSAIPGGVTLLAGLGIMLTRSRGLGGFLAFMAALGGAWLIAGVWIVQLLPASVASSITVGSPIGTTTATRIALTELGVFFGVGALIVFFAALALGRFSIAAAKDQEQLSSFLTSAASGADTGAGFATTQPQYAADPYPSYSPDPFPPQYSSETYQPGQYGSQYPSEPAGPDIDTAQTQTQFPTGPSGS
jgi:hypothetical protein